MRTLCALAVVTTAAGVIASLPMSTALACDNDRFPCPIVSDAPETTEAPAKAAPGAPPRKKATQAAPRQDERATHQDDKARPKSEREASRAPSRAKAAKPEKQEQAVDSGTVAPAAATPAPAEIQGNENPGPAIAAWPVAPPVAPATPGAVATGAEGAAAPALAKGVATVDPNEVNELDLAAAPTPGPAESSWIKYLLATLGAALAAASTVRFLFV